MTTNNTETQLLGNFDATVWAKEFISINKGKTVKEGCADGELDEGTMIGWFANAITNGYDTSTQKISAEIRRLVDIQGQDGNWKYDEYMRGMYNGLVLALATIEGGEVLEYRSEPTVYLKDISLNQISLTLPSSEPTERNSSEKFNSLDLKTRHESAYAHAMKVIR